MKTFIKGLLVICFVTAIHGDKCCVPKQWHGYQYGKGNFLKVTSIEAERVYYDAKNKKFALSGVSVKDGITTPVKFISDHSARILYDIQPANRECKTETISSDFPEYCIPDNAEELETSYVGIGEDKLGVKAYKYQFNDGGFDLQVFAVVAANGCIPFSVDKRGKFNNDLYHEIVNYIAITPGIDNATIFDPPDYCLQENTNEDGDKILREHGIFNF